MDEKKNIMFRQIGAKIAYYRKLRQMTQIELAEKVNLSKSAIGRIERGKYNRGVSQTTLRDIAKGLSVDLSSLTTFNEEEKNIWWEMFLNSIEDSNYKKNRTLRVDKIPFLS